MSGFSDVVKAIHARLDDKSIDMKLGRKALKEHSQTRRVVWVRAAGAIRAPRDQGGKQVSGDRHRTIYTIALGVDAHIYTKEEDEAETLLANLVAAIHTELGPNVEFGQFDWETETDTNSDVARGHTIRGPKIRLSMFWLAPVTDEIAKLTPLEQQTHVGNFENAEGGNSETVC